MTKPTQNNPQFSNPLHQGLAVLPQWGLIIVEGPDAATFLQNQLSNSVLGLKRTLSPEIAKGNGGVRLVGYCNPKGRLMASAWLGLFPVNDTSDDRFALFISRDIATAFAKRLSMFVLRSKVTVKDVSDEWLISGIYDENKPIDDLHAAAGTIGLRMPDVAINTLSYGRILMAEPASVSRSTKESTTQCQNMWNYLEVMSAIPRIVLATQEQFVPQMINFESVAGVDFKKGCYPGQEIVARSQYRGVIKRRLQLAHGSYDPANLTLFQAGVEVFHSEDPSQPAGMIVLAAANPFENDRIDLQVECKLEPLETGGLRVANPKGPALKLDALPYPLIEI